MKYHCIIVDDEPIAQQILENYISQVGSLQLVQKCNNAFEALDILHRRQIDILFLDIKMPVLSGLEMLKTLANPPKVILTTAFSEFGVESYEYGITDYLLKPIAFQRFLRAVNKVLMPRNMDIVRGSAEENLTEESSFMFFKADKKVHKFYFSEILYIEGSGNYVKIYNNKEKPLLVLDKLNDLQEKLPQKIFLRVHKSYIVNVNHISKVEGNMLKMSSKEVPFSAHYRKNVEMLIKENG
jgi:DNA-binding LytR/AlgR family response regulator